jgi:hypothetical protein
MGRPVSAPAIAAYGVARSHEEPLREITRTPMTSKPGPAAWLATVCERVLRDFKYDFPGRGITHLNVDVPW